MRILVAAFWTSVLAVVALVLRRFNYQTSRATLQKSTSMTTCPSVDIATVWRFPHARWNIQQRPPVSYHEDLNSMHLWAGPRNWLEEENSKGCVQQETGRGNSSRFFHLRVPVLLSCVHPHVGQGCQVFWSSSSSLSSASAAIIHLLICIVLINLRLGGWCHTCAVGSLNRDFDVSRRIRHLCGLLLQTS